MRRQRARYLLIALACVGVCLAAAPSRAKEAATGDDIFASRILPIFRSKDPSSCTECHLAAVDLKDYIRPTARDTFVSLRDQGLIDLEAPEQSRILELIRMEPKKPAPLPSRRRAEELAAFEAWILSAARDPMLRDLPPLPEKKLARPERPDGVIRHARKSRLLKSFEEWVWGDRERCASCHQPPKNAKQVKEFGDRVSWIVADDPEATMDLIVKNGLVDAKKPEKSKLLAKPTLQKEHKGGLKMIAGDENYERWLVWIRDWARTVSGGYKTEKDLPEIAETTVISDNYVRLVNPKPWKGFGLRLDIHAWDEAAGRHEERRCAACTRIGGPKGAMARLYVYAAPGSERHRYAQAETSLPPGKYQARVYLDKRYKRKAGKPPKFRRKPDYTADLDLTWKKGKQNRTVITLE